MIAPKSTVKILFLEANPAETEGLALGVELREIRKKIKASRGRDRFELLWEPAFQVGSLQTLLVDHEPQIVHFSGHGERLSGGGGSGSRGALRPPRPAAPTVAAPTVSALVAHDDADGPALLEAEPLARAFEILGRQVRVVVLNACYSDDVAAALVQRVDVVLGMADAIDDQSAVEFSATFYGMLASGKSVQDAFDAAKNQLALKDLPDAQVPRLRQRVPAAGVIFAALDATPTASTADVSETPREYRHLECDRHHAWDYLCEAAGTPAGHVLFLCGQPHFGHEQFVERVRRLAAAALARSGPGALIVELGRKIFDNTSAAAGAELIFADAVNKLSPGEDTVESKLCNLLAQRSVIVLYPTVSSQDDAAWAREHYAHKLPALIGWLAPPPSHGLVAVQPIRWEKGLMDWIPALSGHRRTHKHLQPVLQEDDHAGSRQVNGLQIWEAPLGRITEGDLAPLLTRRFKDDPSTLARARAEASAIVRKDPDDVFDWLRDYLK